MTLHDPELVIRPALATDVRRIRALVKSYVDARAIVPKPAVAYYEGVQEFLLVERGDRLVGCGALHVMWEDVAEVRTLAVDPMEKGQGIGSTLLTELLQRARTLAVKRVFCLTFEVGFFARHGFSEIEGEPVAADVYAEMLQSYDEGVAEFLDLDRVKPNTLGNHRMLLTL
ncbi:amino-acid N-acetyltransferase [Flexivirga caeni]|uniref:Amino-acid N-acetyltransferase n=1 Tax=Flexivirga caeni TaxID=2294115 RepID=A0A3M9MI32_9MICO|nr:amino-acid N-acetyltransferase [Flexivirga caeni]RNI25186.1 amino-acid N-acetyltransferase [Flexivirga caeni]